MAENVGGLRNANDGKAFQVILQELTEAGYTIVPHLYKFEKYGVPQSRHRIIIVRHDIDVSFKVPAPLDTPQITCKEAITNPPIPASAKKSRTNQTSKTRNRTIMLYQRRRKRFYGKYAGTFTA